MKRGKTRIGVCKMRMPKSVLRRVRLKSSGLIICKQRMRNHCMLNRSTRTSRNNALYGSEAKVVRTALGLSNKKQSKSNVFYKYCEIESHESQEASI